MQQRARRSAQPSGLATKPTAYLGRFDMLLTFLRRLLATEPMPTVVHPVPQVPSERDQVLFEQLLLELKARIPEDLKQSFEYAVQTCGEKPVTGPELLDSLDKVHMGLGIAIGRGEGSLEHRYSELERVIAWLYRELDRPQNTSYAVTVRAAQKLQEREAKRGEA